MHLTCPHCLNPIELLAERPKEVVCPACGSSIMVDPSRTATWLPAGPSRRVGRFELLEQLGMGAFGTVYKARDTELDRTVALKIPRSGTLATQEDVEKLLREARSAAQLKHPNIVSLYDAGRSDDTCYLVSEFVEGATLGDRLSAGPLGFREAAQLVADAADTLDYAHEQGVIHRDIKPSNIMLDLEGRPHLMDFGLAKREAGEITVTLDGQVLGTPAYMSPEQARGEAHNVDARSDVYSLGVVLYRLLTGELPFRGNSRMLLVQVLHDEPRPPRRINDKIPRDLETITLEAMAKAPARRYPTARSLADDLRLWLGGQPIHARPVGRAERLWRWCRRKPAIASLAASLALVFAGGFAAVSWQWRNAHAAATSERSAVARLKAQQGELIAARSVAERKEHEAQQAAEREKAAKETVANIARQYRFLEGITVAHRAWTGARVNRTLELLDALRPVGDQQDLRSFEWYLLWRLSHQDKMTLRGHTADLTSVAFSPDGTTLATASEDMTIRLWDVQTGRARLVLRGHDDEVTCVKFAPEGNTLASASADKTARVWDAATGQQIATLEGHADPVQTLSFSPNGSTLITGAGTEAKGEAKVWDWRAGQEIATLPGHNAPVHHIAYSRDGAILATASRGFPTPVDPAPAEVKVWNVATFAELRTFQAQTGELVAMAFAPDNSLITGGYESSAKGSILIWDLDTGESRSPFKLDALFVLAMAFSPDGKLLATETGQMITLWDMATGAPQQSFRGHSGLIAAMDFAPDGRTLATAAKSGDATAKLWDVSAAPNPLALAGHTGWVSCVAFTPDGKRLATASRTLHVKDAPSAEIILWDPASGERLSTLIAQTRDVYSLAFAPDGKTLAAGGDDKTVKLWDVATGDLRTTLRGHEVPVTQVAFSPDGRTLATADGESYSMTPDGGAMDTWSRPGRVKLWNMADQRVRATLDVFHEPVSALAFCPDGKLLGTGSKDGEVRIWEAESVQMVNVTQAFTKFVTALAFAPNGETLAVAGVDRGPTEIGDIKLYDTASWTQRSTLLGHANIVNSLAFAPDGKTLASGSWDGTIRLWDPLLGLERFALVGQQVNAVAFSPGGTLLASGSADKTVRIWRAATEQEVQAREAK